MTRSRILFVRRMRSLLRSNSLSRLMPSGVSSKIQASVTAGIKPMASIVIRTRIAWSPRPNAGKVISASCIRTQDTAT